MQAPLLRVYWPRKLTLPQHPLQADVQLIGQQERRAALQEEVVVVAAAAPDGTTHPPAVGTLLSPASSIAEGPNGSTSSSLAFLLQPTIVPGGLLPILLPPAPAAWAGGSTNPLWGTRQPTASSHQQQADQGQQEEQQQQQWDVQIVLYDGSAPLQLERVAAGPPTAPTRAQKQRVWRQPRQLRAQLASHLAGVLLAALLLAYRQGLAAGVAHRGCQLADFASSQVGWFMTAQPAGVKLHRHLCELLGFASLQYTAAVQRLLAGRAQQITMVATGLLATALVAGGLQRGLLAVECMLWLLALPLSMSYAAMAAALRWQLRSTALMWRVMRGKQQLAPLRQRVACWWRQAVSRNCGTGRSRCCRQGSTEGAAPAQASPPTASAMASFACSPGSGLKQLSGSMLLFMPLLLLLPTTAWFYGFALVLHTAASTPCAAAQLLRQVVAHDPLGAAVRQLLSKPSTAGSAVASSSNGSSSSGGSSCTAGASVCDSCAEYLALEVRFQGVATLPAWAQRAAEQTTYLQAVRRQHGRPWQAAAAAIALAWTSCSFSVVPMPHVLQAALCGRQLFLAFPGLRAADCAL